MQQNKNLSHGIVLNNIDASDLQMTPVAVGNELNSVVVYNSKDISIKVPSSVDRLRRQRRRRSLNVTGKFYYLSSWLIFNLISEVIESHYQS